MCQRLNPWTKRLSVAGFNLVDPDMPPTASQPSQVAGGLFLVGGGGGGSGGPCGGPSGGGAGGGGGSQADDPTPKPSGGGSGGSAQDYPRQSNDPNAMYGPAGYGTSNFVQLAGAVFPYQIDFENSPTATAPAQEVTIADQLDPNLDWSSFQLTGIGWGNFYLTIPAGSQAYQTTVPMTYNGETFDVEVQAGIHTATGLVYATFLSIDPQTGLPPSNVLTGFLPPENGTGRGQGYVSYLVAPKSGLATGTQITNVALISFDQQPQIATDQVDDDDPSQGVTITKEALVTIDAGPPTSSVSPLPATEPSTSFTVSWSGQDDPGGSGIASYNVYVSDNGGAFTLWQSADTQTSATFTGQNGHTYGFYSIATDNVGNQEAAKAAADASTTITLPTAQTWSGGGTDNHWSSAANWSPLAAPNPGESLVFQGAAQTTTDNDLPEGTSLKSITLASPGFLLAGNAVTLASQSTPVVTLAAASGTIQLPITLGSDATIAVTDPQGSLADSGNIDNGGYSLTFDTSSSQSSTLSGSISGAGAFIKTDSGAVVLSGSNSFSGGTQVLAGSLVVTSSAVLPDGSSLTVGAGGTFVFDPSQAGTSVAAAGVAAPAAASETPSPIGAASILAKASVTAPVVPTLSRLVQRQAENLFFGPAVMSRATIDAVFASHRSAVDQTVSSPGIPHSAGSWAWLAAIESSWNSSDQNKTTESNVAALDRVLARFGV